MIDAVSPVNRLFLVFGTLLLSSGLTYTYWPSGLGLAACLLALLILLPLTLVSALDVVRQLKSRSPTTDTTAALVLLSLPLGLLAFLALAIGIAFAVFLGFKLTSEHFSESPRILLGGLIAGAMFLGFGVRLFQVLWSRRHDKTIRCPYMGSKD